jgi:glycosyltransferase involved in cell wall biosynthesis
MEQLRTPVIKTHIVSAHGLRKNSPDGVTNVILESQRQLEGRVILGDRLMHIKLVGPRIPVKDNDLADVNVGRRNRRSINKTEFEASVLYTGKPTAKKFLEVENPDLIIVHQPLAGNVTHSLMTADEKKEICFVGYFHAQAEELDIETKLLMLAVSLIRRPTRSGLTPGFINTINNRFDGKVAVSHVAGEFWDKFLPGDYEIIYNGIDTDRFKPGETKKEWKQNEEKIIFAAARFDERKGLDVLLRAMGILVFEHNMKDVRVKIAGDGKMKTELLALSSQLRLENYVEFLGFETPEDLVKDYATADVFVSPALGGEAFGLTLGEAMACETVVVGSNISGYNEVIGGNLPFAFLTEPGDPKDVAGKLRTVLNMDPVERRNRGKLARKHVEENFSLTKNINHQANYYERCLRLRSKHNSHGGVDWPELPRSETLYTKLQ